MFVFGHLNANVQTGPPRSFHSLLPAGHFYFCTQSKGATQMNRSQRRAAERLAAHNQNNPTSAQTNSSSPISQAQLAANRANAQHSTGPKSEAGRATSSLNAVKTALTGRTVLMPSDDAVEYQNYIQAHQDQYKPVGIIECYLLQSIVDCGWRLRRISSLEQAVFSVGRREFAEQFQGQSADPTEIDLHTSQVHQKELRNLHLQESRLFRRREKELAELRALQAERRQKEEAALAEASAVYLAAQAAGASYEPTPDENGFVFTTPQIQRYLAAQTSNQQEKMAPKSKQAAA